MDIARNSLNELSELVIHKRHEMENQLFQIGKCTNPNHLQCVLIKACHSGKYLGFSRGQMRSGAQLLQTDEKSLSNENHFRLVFAERKYYFIEPSHMSGYCITLEGGETKNRISPKLFKKRTSEEGNFHQQFSFIEINEERAISLRRMLFFKECFEQYPN